MVLMSLFYFYWLTFKHFLLVLKPSYILVIIIEIKKLISTGIKIPNNWLGVYTYNTIIHFIETRLQNTIGTVIKIQIAWLTCRLASNLVTLKSSPFGSMAIIEQEKMLKEV